MKKPFQFSSSEEDGSSQGSTHGALCDLADEACTEKDDFEEAAAYNRNLRSHPAPLPTSPTEEFEELQLPRSKLAAFIEERFRRRLL